MVFVALPSKLLSRVIPIALALLGIAFLADADAQPSATRSASALYAVAPATVAPATVGTK
jgi:hypothetical protein